MNVREILAEYNIEPDTEKDQHFLVDRDVLQKIVGYADLHKEDIVLEIGAGVGNLTNELSKQAGHVVAVEVDERFQPILSELSKQGGNIEVIFENARHVFKQGGKFRKKKEWNKVVSNMPYALCESLLHNLAFVEYDKAILLVPQSFAEFAHTSPVFKSFFDVQEKLTVGKESFYPKPKTTSVVIDLVRLPDPITTGDRPLFLRQYLYQHEDQKSFNALTEGLVVYEKLTSGNTLSKNEARNIIREADIDEALLQKNPRNPEIYEELEKKFQ